MKKLQEILRLLRIEKNLSQENLARDLGLSVTSCAKTEWGETDVNYSRLEKMAEYYGLNVYELLVLGVDENKNVSFDSEKYLQLQALLLRNIELLEEAQIQKLRMKLEPKQKNPDLVKDRDLYFKLKRID